MKAARVLLLAGLVVLVAGCGSGRHISSSNGRPMTQPAWSPNGLRIAWDEHTKVLSESVIWVSSADGTNPHPVTQPIDALGQLTWLTNRELLFWANFRVFRLWLGSKPTLVSSVNGTSFSVDGHGTRIASGSSDCPTCVSPIQVIPLVPGAERVDIGPADVQNSSPSLAPDGRSVVFGRNLCSRASGECLVSNGVWTAATTSGATPRRIVRNGVCPAWSPRGNEIFYAWDTGYVVPAAGGVARALPVGASCAVWSPNGQMLATIGADSRLSVVDAHTARARALPAAGAVNSFAWSPDSSTLLVAASRSSTECTALWTVAVATRKATEIRACR